MPDAPPAETPKPDPAEAAEMLGTALNRLGIDYALGGAIALGYWAQPRGTLDVDLTRFLTPGDHQSVLDTLREIGCEFDPDAVRALLVEHSFCRARFRGVDVDVFLPMFDSTTSHGSGGRASGWVTSLSTSGAPRRSPYSR